MSSDDRELKFQLVSEPMDLALSIGYHEMLRPLDALDSITLLDYTSPYEKTDAYKQFLQSLIRQNVELTYSIRDDYLAFFNTLALQFPTSITYNADRPIQKWSETPDRRLNTMLTEFQQKAKALYHSIKLFREIQNGVSIDEQQELLSHYERLIDAFVTITDVVQVQFTARIAKEFLSNS